MGITLGSNGAALSAQRRLSDVTAELRNTFERLSSGQRINRASDDAAGLAIADSLRADRKVFTQGIRNFNDGVSTLNVADGALSELSNIMTRVAELAEQASNGTLAYSQRQALDSEAGALVEEYNRIVQTTEFNNLNLINGSISDLTLQGGYGEDGSITMNFTQGSVTDDTFLSNVGTGDFEDTVDSIAFSGGGFTFASPGDINGDGIIDLVATSNYGVEARLGNGDGTFQAAYNILAGPDLGVGLGDFNGDGYLDGVARTTANGQRLLINNGDGTFTETAHYEAGANIREAVIADINNDGRDDLVTLLTGSTDIRVRLGQADGTLAVSTTLTASSNVSRSDIGDINNDGILDIAHYTTGNDIDVFIGDGSGGFSLTGSIASSSSQTANQARLEDINGDGYEEFVVAGTGGVRLYTNNNGTFSGSPTSLLATAQSHMTADDINEDGNIDILTNTGSSVNVLLGNGDNTFQDLGIIANTAPTNTSGFAVADINHDGALEVLRGMTNGSIAVLNPETTVSAEIATYDLKSLNGARLALEDARQKIDGISQFRGNIGAVQSRLSVGIANLKATTENLASAESRIRDVDVAAESANLVRQTILQEAAAAVLAQANQQPALSLRLISE